MPGQGRLRVLVVEDDDDDFVLTRDLLSQAGSIAVERARTYTQAVKALDAGYDAVLADHSLGTRTGVDLVREAAARGIGTPVVLLTGQGGRELDVQAMRAGAADFLEKGELTPTLLERTLRYAVEHGRAQAELRESRRALSTLLGNLPGMAYRCRMDPRFTLEFASEGALGLTGYTPGELVENRVAAFGDLIVEADRDRVWGEVEEAVREGRPFQLEYRIVHRAGGERWVQENGVPVQRQGLQPVLEGFIADVTERREGEEALRTRERHFRSLIENAHDIITVLEGDGDVRFVSPSVERTLGYPRAGLMGVYLFELVHPDDVPAVLEVFDRAIRSPGEPQWLEFRIRHAGGGYRMLEAIGTSLLDDPAVAGIVVNSRDVTERKQAEEALRLSQQQLLQAQKMDAVGRLAGGVAHDFNNLLTAIRGNAELLLFDIPAGDPRRDDVEEIRKAADRAAALTRQLLAFSRRQVLQPRVLDLNGVVGEMDRMLRRLIGEDVELVTRLAPGVEQVRADPGQVEQVVLNLAVNARDAMPGGGRLTVETANAELDGELKRTHPYVVPGRYVMLCVSDTGQGMDPETLERAFEPFFTTKPAGRGTGLGLSTVYGIVKQSGGFVWIDSELGRGTRVRIYLPPVAAPAAPPPAAAGAAPQRRGEGTVLLAEDEVTVRRLAVRVLRRGGFTVLEAADGEQALAVAAGHPGTVDLLVTDLVMPRLGGRDLAARLRESRPGVPVVYVSGYAEEAVQRDGVLDPGARFLSKPFTAEQLLDVVHAALRDARAESTGTPASQPRP